MLDLGAAVHAVRMSESITTGAAAEQQGHPARASMASLQEELIREAGAQQLEPGKDSQGIGHQSQHIVPQNASVWYSSPLNSKLS